MIKQKESGAHLYIVESGQLDCFKKFDNENTPRLLKTYQPGESFGELALLYNTPRAASIQSKTNTILFCLDRECFNDIVKEAAMKKRQKYEEFLSKVDLLLSMDPYEKSKIADALQIVKFQKGDYVLKEVALQL